MKKINIGNHPYTFSKEQKSFPRSVGLIITNGITFTRLLGLYPIIQSFQSGKFFQTGLLAAVVGITDKLDGWAANYLNGKSKFGALADAVTDKVFGIILNVLLLSLHPLFILNLIGELEIGGLNLGYRLFKKVKGSSTMMGKVKTVTLFSEFALSLLLFHTPAFEMIILPMILGNFAFQNIVAYQYHNIAQEKLVNVDMIKPEELAEKNQTEHQYTLSNHKQKITEYQRLREEIRSYKVTTTSSIYETDQVRAKIKVKRTSI